MNYCIFNSDGLLVSEVDWQPMEEMLAVRQQVAVAYERQYPDSSLRFVDGEVVETPPQPSVYHVWDREAKAWTLPPEAEAAQLNHAIALYTERINDTVAAIQQPLVRFTPEYELREVEALAFQERGFTGEVPRQVAAFANPTGLTPKEAALKILKQAKRLREVLNQLGELRMRKFELQHLTTSEAVQERAEEILNQIDEVGRMMN